MGGVTLKSQDRKTNTSTVWDIQVTQNHRNAFLPGIIKLPSSRVTMETRLRHWEELAGPASGGWEHHSVSTSEKEPERLPIIG